MRCGSMSEEVSGSSEVVNPCIDGELWLSSEKMGEGGLLDLLVAAKKEVSRYQGLAGESVQLLGMSLERNQTRPSEAISFILGYLLVFLSLGMIYALLSVFETLCEGPLPT